MLAAHTTIESVYDIRWRSGVYILQKRRSKKLRFISDPEINWLAIKFDGIIVHKQDFPENEIELPPRVRAQQSKSWGEMKWRSFFFAFIAWEYRTALFSSCQLCRWRQNEEWENILLFLLVYGISLPVDSGEQPPTLKKTMMGESESEWAGLAVFWL